MPEIEPDLEKEKQRKEKQREENVKINNLVGNF